MRRFNIEDEDIWLQGEVIEYLRCAPSSFFACKQYLWLREKAIKDGKRKKYRKADVMAFIEHLQKSA